MVGSKYYDSTAVVQLIGCSIAQPSLLDGDGQYFFNEHDFTNEFHKTLFGVIYNLRQMGAENITVKTIEDYLSNRPQSLGIYKNSNGSEWVLKTSNNADLANFDYYYQRVKKMTLLRNYDEVGIDVTWIYDPDNILDVQKKQEQENQLDRLSLEQIADMIESKVFNVRSNCVDNSSDNSILIGDKVEGILDSLMEEPEIGSSFYDEYMNALTRGARLGKFYIRSAATGVGKTRTMIADICTIGCDKIYDSVAKDWKDIGIRQPALYISTELDISEVTTMMLSFISNVNEEHIVKNCYDFGEKDRVKEAVNILKRAPIYIEEMPDFTMKDIENCIKRNIRTRSTQYIFYDYLHSSMGILQEVARAANGTKLREDNILFLLAVKLKDIANQFNVFVMTSTQLNGRKK